MSQEEDLSPETDAELMRAWDLLETGDAAAARGLLESWQADHRLQPEVLLLEAACHRTEENFEGAIQILKQLEKDDDDWATPSLWLAEILVSVATRDDDLAYHRQLRAALGHATKAVDRADDEDEYFDAVLIKTDIELELGQEAEARKTLASLPPVSVLADAPAFALEIASFHVDLDDPDAALELLDALMERESDPAVMADAHHLLGVIADRDDDADVRTENWLKTLELDEHLTPDETQRLLTEDEVVRVSEAALGELPEQARALLANVPILVAGRPGQDDVKAGVDPRALGLFVGASTREDSVLGPGEGLKQIFLYRDNLERFAGDPGAMREEVRTTLLHETGHFFGMNEEDLAELGLD